MRSDPLLGKDNSTRGLEVYSYEIESQQCDQAVCRQERTSFKPRVEYPNQRVGSTFGFQRASDSSQGDRLDMVLGGVTLVCCIIPAIKCVSGFYQACGAAFPTRSYTAPVLVRMGWDRDRGGTQRLPPPNTPHSSPKLVPHLDLDFPLSGAILLTSF